VAVCLLDGARTGGLAGESCGKQVDAARAPGTRKTAEFTK